MSDRKTSPHHNVDLEVIEHDPDLYPGSYPHNNSLKIKSKSQFRSNVKEKKAKGRAPRFDPSIEDVALTSYQYNRSKSRPFAQFSVDSMLHNNPPAGEVNQSHHSKFRSSLPNERYPKTTGDPRLYSSDRVKGGSDRRTGDSAKGSLSRKSILRHSYDGFSKETIADRSSSSNSSSCKRVSFQDQIKRKVIPSPQLVELVRSDSESSLTSTSSGNLISPSELSVSSGTGSLQDLRLVDFTISSAVNDPDSEQIMESERQDHSSQIGSVYSGDKPSFQTPFTRLTRQYSSNDSDYSTENESLYGVEQIRQNEQQYESSDSCKSSAYSSSSSIKSPFSYSRTKLEQNPRGRVVSDSSDEDHHHNRESKLQKIQVKEVLHESDEELNSSSSNSTLAESSSSDNEIILASGITIRREKFTSGSEFESSGDSDNGGKNPSWMMTVMEHRGSSPVNATDTREHPIVTEKEIDFKFRSSVKTKETSDSSCQSDNVITEETTPVKEPPMTTSTETSFSEKADVSIGTDDFTDSTVSLTMVTPLDGCLTQNSAFDFPMGDNDMTLQSLSHSSIEISSIEGVNSPYDLVKQIVKTTEDLAKLQHLGKSKNIVDYSTTSLSSISITSDVSSSTLFGPSHTEQQGQQQSKEEQVVNDPKGTHQQHNNNVDKEKPLMVSTGTSPTESHLFDTGTVTEKNLAGTKHPIIGSTTSSSTSNETSKESSDKPSTVNTIISPADTDAILKNITPKNFAYKKVSLDENKNQKIATISSDDDYDNSSSSLSHSTSTLYSADISDQTSDSVVRTLEQCQVRRKHSKSCNIEEDTSSCSENIQSAKTDTSSFHSADRRLAERVFNEVESMIKSSQTPISEFEGTESTSSSNATNVEDVNSYLKHLTQEPSTNNLQNKAEPAGTGKEKSNATSSYEIAGPKFEMYARWSPSTTNNISPRDSTTKAARSSFEKMHYNSKPCSRSSSGHNLVTLDQVPTLRSSGSSNRGDDDGRGVPRLSSLSDNTHSEHNRSSGLRRRKPAQFFSSSSEEDNPPVRPPPRTSSYSNKLKASSHLPETATDSSDMRNKIVDYDSSSSGDRTSQRTSPDFPDGVPENLVYSIKFKHSSEDDELSKVLSGSDTGCLTESSSIKLGADEITEEEVEEKKGRYTDDYGLLRAMRWIMCPCAD